MLVFSPEMSLNKLGGIIFGEGCPSTCFTVLLSGTTSKALHRHHWKVPVAVAVAVGCVVFVSVLLGIASVHFYRSRLLMASAGTSFLEKLSDIISQNAYS